MKGSVVFDHILEILKDPYTCESYGQDYCSILLKNVLSVRKYVVELDSKQLHGKDSQDVCFHNALLVLLICLLLTN